MTDQDRPEPLPLPVLVHDVAWVPLLDLPWRDDDRDRKDHS